MSPKRDLIERLEKLEGFDGYCTDCEGVTRIINGRCGCGSGRVVTAQSLRALSQEPSK